MSVVRCQCGQLLSLPAGAVGRRLRCSVCAQAIKVSRKPAYRAGPVEPPPPRPVPRPDLATCLAFASLIPVVIVSLCVGLSLPRGSTPVILSEGSLARPVDVAATEPRYAGDAIEPLPKLPSMAETRTLRDDVFRYLEKKSGRKAAAAFFSPGAYTAGVCVEAYDTVERTYKTAAEKNLHCYRALHEHLLGAEALFNETDPERRLDGLDVVRETALCSVERLGDKWLGPRICHGFLIPRLQHASTESYDKLSTANLIATSIYVFGQAGSQADVVTCYRLLLHFSDDANTREATRLRLANELAGQGDLAEAIRYLKGIQPDGHIGGARALIAELENKMKANQRKEKKNAK